MPTEITIFLKPDEHGTQKLLYLKSDSTRAEALEKLTLAISKHEAIMGDDPDRHGVTIWVPWHSIERAEVIDVDE